MLLYYVATLLPLLLCHNVNGHTRVDPLVDTKVGLIRGIKATDGDYSKFLGIPYATVNKSNPFGPSIPTSHFEDAFEAYHDSNFCPQFEEFGNTLVGTLDCLQLNIYVPNSASSQNRLPVLVWIHGGGFGVGSSRNHVFGAKYLVRHNVILVTINYRLGAYGFMCLNKPEISGNQGLKDQLIAFRWINENIESFGGDPSKVTLFGESAGGVSIDMHLLYGNENLFQNVIMQSGASIYYQTIQEPDEEAPLSLANHLGFAADSVDEALTFLTTVEPKLIIAATSELGVGFRPCVENEFENANNYILEYPLYRKLNRRNIPILLGFNDDEIFYFYSDKNATFFENNNIIKEFLSGAFSFDTVYLSEMEELVRHFYLGDDKITNALIIKMRDFANDVQYIHRVKRSVDKYIKEGVQRMYYYLFSYTGQRNYGKKTQNITAVGGAAHADEIGYLFDVSFWPDEPTPEDQLIIDRMTTLWTNFAKYSNPTPQTDSLLPVLWSPVTEDTLYCLNIDTEVTLLMRPYHDRMAFWDLFYKLNDKYQREYKEQF